MPKYNKARQKPKTDKDFIKEAIKTYIAKTAFSKKTKSTKINGFVSLCLAPNLKELLYQNRLHTFGKNKIAWNEFNDKCHSIFTIGYTLNKTTSYEISLFKMIRKKKIKKEVVEKMQASKYKISNQEILKYIINNNLVDYEIKISEKRMNYWRYIDEEKL